MLLNDKEKAEIYSLWNDENWTKAGLARAYGVSARTIGRVIDVQKAEQPEEKGDWIVHSGHSDRPSDDQGYEWFFNSGMTEEGPLPGDVIVEVQIRDGDNLTCKVSEYDWTVDGHPGDIIKYRLVESSFEEDSIEKDDAPEYKYDIVATKNVINIYRTDQNNSGDSASAVVQKSENERLFDIIYQDLKQGVDDQNVLEACFNKINLKAYIESVSLGNVKVAPTEGLVYYEGEDGEHVRFSGGLVDRIIRLVKDAHETDTPYTFNRELTGLQKFAERLKNNPSQRAINELYDFIKHSDIQIREDGMVECYKRIRGDFMDIFTGTMDNSVGQVLEIPRSQVDPDADRTCSYGLHVCSKTYLPFYGTADSNVTVKVLVDPADFVAIPSDYNQPVIGCEEGEVAPSKARVCRYEVIELATDAELL